MADLWLSSCAIGWICQGLFAPLAKGFSFPWLNMSVGTSFFVCPLPQHIYSGKNCMVITTNYRKCFQILPMCFCLIDFLWEFYVKISKIVLIIYSYYVCTFTFRQVLSEQFLSEQLLSHFYHFAHEHSPPFDLRVSTVPLL